jgi:SAM-dependent methyltransferase
MTVPGWPEDDREAIRYFSALVEKHGIDAHSLDWGSRESQRLRFTVLAQIGPLEGASVLDVGCGLGDFFGWLSETGQRVRYTGIDITPAMVEIAAKRFPDAQFEVCNILEGPPAGGPFDYVFASGIFYLRRTEPFPFLRRMVETMFGLCTRGTAFNSLSAWAPRREPGEFYADPLDTLAFCRTLTTRLSLRHDYHPQDFTMHLHKQKE